MWLVVTLTSKKIPKPFKSPTFTFVTSTVDSLTMGTGFRRSSLDKIRNLVMILCFFTIVYPFSHSHLPFYLRIRTYDIELILTL